MKRKVSEEAAAVDAAAAAAMGTVPVLPSTSVAGVACSALPFLPLRLLLPGVDSRPVAAAAEACLTLCPADLPLLLPPACAAALSWWNCWMENMARLSATCSMSVPAILLGRTGHDVAAVAAGVTAAAADSVAAASAVTAALKCLIFLSSSSSCATGRPASSASTAARVDIGDLSCWWRGVEGDVAAAAAGSIAAAGVAVAPAAAENGNTKFIKLATVP